MRHLIFGTIGTLWGASIIASNLFRTPPANVNAAYQAGANMSLVFGSLLLFVGIATIVKGARKLKAPAPVS